MKLPKEIYHYIEYEMFHYEEYKEALELERERILESSPNRTPGLRNKSKTTDITCAKAISLTESTAVMSLERRIRAVDKTLAMLSDTHRRLFTELYVKCRKDIVSLCNDLAISRETYARYKRSIIYGVGNEMGLIPLQQVV